MTNEPVRVRLVSQDAGPWVGTATCRAGHRHHVLVFPTPGGDWVGRDDLHEWAQQHGSCRLRWWMRSRHKLMFLDAMLLAATGAWIALAWWYTGRLTRDSHAVLFMALVAWTLLHTPAGLVVRLARWFGEKYQTRR